MRHFLYVLYFSFLTLTVANAQSNEQPENAKAIEMIYHMDSLFWEAYNLCDVEKMATFFTDDVEFYHDKAGLTTTKAKLIESTRAGMCGNPNWRLRRVPIEGTVKVYPLNDYGGLISGEHVFYILEEGKEEYLDGYGKFTQVWVHKDGSWKMSRVLSYDHGPAPYINKRKDMTLSPDILKRYIGQYEFPQSGVLSVTQDGNTLSLAGKDFHSTLFPESEFMFFSKERDLQFEFVRESNQLKMIVYEKGNKVEEGKLIK